MKFSVIISTYNSPQWLEKVLWGYQCQVDGGFEVVIADDGSSEETRQLIAAFKSASGFPIRHVWHEDDGFRKWQIVNRAIETAEGEYLIFTDGDCIPHPGLVRTHREFARPSRFLSGGYCKLPMETSKAIGRDDIVSGRAFSLGWLKRHGYSFTPKWLKIAAPQSGFSGLLNRLTPAARTFNGNNASCFKSDALRVRGFDERIRYGGGDREFGYRLQHAGVSPYVIRYSTVCLHLDHPRSYKSAEVRRENMAMIEETLRTRRTETAFGISEPS